MPKLHCHVFRHISIVFHDEHELTGVSRTAVSHITTIIIHIMTIRTDIHEGITLVACHRIIIIYTTGSYVIATCFSICSKQHVVRDCSE